MLLKCNQICVPFFLDYKKRKSLCCLFYKVIKSLMGYFHHKKSNVVSPTKIARGQGCKDGFT